MSKAAPRVLVVDGHRVFAETLALALGSNGFEDVLVVDEINLRTVLLKADEFKPRVVVLDLDLDDSATSLAMIAPLVARGISVLVLTSTGDRGDLLAECLEAGAAGLFDKGGTFDHLLALILDAAVGITVLEPSARQDLLVVLRRHRAENEARLRPFARLSTREREVLFSLIQGLSAEEIARQQFVSIATIRSQIRGILQKLGVNSQLAAVALARGVEWDSITS